MLDYTIMSYARMTEPMEMPFNWVGTRVGPRKHALGGVYTLAPPRRYD